MTTSPAGHADAVAFGFGTSSLGEVLVATTAKGICAIMLGRDRAELADQLYEHFPDAKPQASAGEHGGMITRVIALVDAPAQVIDLPLDLCGSDFELKVWQALRTIPAGSTMSYSGLAELIGMKGQAYEVSQACAANRIAVAVPCHRIVRKDGSISGYRWGVQRKRALLKREGAL